MQIVIHDQGVKPTYSEGLLFKPGTYNRITLTKVVSETLPKPYSNCEDLSNFKSVNQRERTHYLLILFNKLNTYSTYLISERDDFDPARIDSNVSLVIIMPRSLKSAEIPIFVTSDMLIGLIFQEFYLKNHQKSHIFQCIKITKY